MWLTLPIDVINFQQILYRTKDFSMFALYLSTGRKVFFSWKMNIKDQKDYFLNLNSIYYHITLLTLLVKILKD